MNTQREIKFRAWSKEFKKMYRVTVVNCQWPQNDGNDDVYVEGDTEQMFLFEGSYDLMQYIGIKDENGIEIYEGDIVKYAKNQNRVVKWTDKGYEPWVCNGEGDHECHSGWHMGKKVIGNIWENPELLIS